MAYPLRLIPSNGRGIVPVFKLSNEPIIGYGNYRCLDPAMADTTIVVCECLPNSYFFHKGPPGAVRQRSSFIAPSPSNQ